MSWQGQDGKNQFFNQGCSGKRIIGMELKKAVRVSVQLFYCIGNSIFTDKGEMTYDMIETMKNGYE